MNQNPNATAGSDAILSVLKGAKLNNLHGDDSFSINSHPHDEDFTKMQIKMISEKKKKESQHSKTHLFNNYFQACEKYEDIERKS